MTEQSYIEAWEAYANEVHQTFQADGFEKYCAENTRGNDASGRDIQAFQAALDAASDERPMQKYLEEHPNLVAGNVGGICRWVIPQARLGDRYVADFLTTRLNSIGLDWFLVELESPRARLFNKSGRLSRQLREGIDQIEDWRLWLDDNRDLAQRPRQRNGLGFRELTGYARGLVIIGRTGRRSDQERAKLMQIRYERQIEVHSYDWLIREARHRMELRAKFGWTDCEECPDTTGHTAAGSR